MKLNRLAGATTATAAAIAIVSGLTLTQHGTQAVTLLADSHPVTSHSATVHSAPSHRAASTTPVDPSLAWLESPGGQAQITFDNEVDTLAGDLETENYAPTVANHLVFEADARTVRAEADKILSSPTLQPVHGRQAYQQMLKDFVTVANLLQPGPGYGTTPQDYAAWYTATKASNITVW